MVKYRPNQQDGPIVLEITSAIRGSLNQWYGSEARLISPEPEIRTFQYCFMLRYAVSISAIQQKMILVKIRRNPKMDSIHQTLIASIHHNMPVEYKTLEYLFENLADAIPDFSAIRPLMFLEKYSAIVMEEFPSKTMTQLIREHRSSRTKWHSSQLKDAARKTGRWLYNFHHYINRSYEKPYTTADILEEARGSAERIEAATRGRVRARPILEQFEDRLANIHFDEVKFSQVHSDMTTNNVLYSDEGKVCIIDIKNRTAPTYMDLGAILTYPETSKSQIFSAGRYYSEALLCKYRAEILAGYFEQEPGSEILARIFAAIKVLDKWRMYEELMGKYKGFKHILSIPIAPFISAYFRNLLKKYLERIASVESGPECIKKEAVAESSV